MRYSFLAVAIIASVLLGGCATTPSPYQNMPITTNVTVQNTFTLAPGQDVVGRTQYIQSARGDTLSLLAQRYDIGYEEILAANSTINPNKRIPTDTVIALPTMWVLPPAKYRKGIVINIPDLRLYYFSGDQVSTFPVALGREGWRTPLATTYVYRKTADPTWHVPDSIRQYYFQKYGQEQAPEVGPGPDNPLGKYAIYLHMPGYLIHGTNDQSSVGHFVSSGCIRMYAPDIEQLFNAVSKGVPASIIYYPSLAGWREGKLYLSAREQIVHEQGLYQVHEVYPVDAVQEAVGIRPAEVNWIKVNSVVSAHTGIPAVIGRELSVSN